MAPSPTSTPPRIRVLCVDDNRDVTAALALCLEREPDIESVGALHSADDLMRQVSERRADVVLLDMNMPGMDPLAALRQLGRGDRPGVSVIVFSGRDDQQVADEAAEAGACGFISKHAEIPVILSEIRHAARWGRSEEGVVPSRMAGPAPERPTR